MYICVYIHIHPHAYVCVCSSLSFSLSLSFVLFHFLSHSFSGSLSHPLLSLALSRFLSPTSIHLFACTPTSLSFSLPLPLFLFFPFFPAYTNAFINTNNWYRRTRQRHSLCFPLFLSLSFSKTVDLYRWARQQHSREPRLEVRVTHTATRCNTAHCNVLQHTLQHTDEATSFPSTIYAKNI